MTKPTKKPTVELKASRIRREPVRKDPVASPAAKAWFDSSEWESWVVIAGVITFAIALTLLSIGIGEVTSH